MCLPSVTTLTVGREGERERGREGEREGGRGRGGEGGEREGGEGEGGDKSNMIINQPSFVALSVLTRGRV